MAESGEDSIAGDRCKAPSTDRPFLILAFTLRRLPRQVTPNTEHPQISRTLAAPVLPATTSPDGEGRTSLFQVLDAEMVDGNSGVVGEDDDPV